MWVTWCNIGERDQGLLVVYGQVGTKCILAKSQACVLVDWKSLTGFRAWTGKTLLVTDLLIGPLILVEPWFASTFAWDKKKLIIQQFILANFLFQVDKLEYSNRILPLPNMSDWSHIPWGHTLFSSVSSSWQSSGSLTGAYPSSQTGLVQTGWVVPLGPYLSTQKSPSSWHGPFSPRPSL